MKEEIDGELVLSEGKEFEVTSDEEGYRGAWYGCTILRLPVNKTKGKVLVQYKHLVEDDYETPLKESLDLSCLRPLPPQTQSSDDQCFQLNDVVDAFHLDGWWTGYVSKLLDDNPKRYIVSFVDPPDVIEFPSSNLRPHWKWVNGKWIKPSKFQEVSSIQLESSDAVKSSSKRHKLVVVNSRKNETSLSKASQEPGKSKPSSIQLESSDVDKSSSKKHKLVVVNYRKNETSLSKASQEPGKSKPVKRKTHEGDATPLLTSKKFKHGSLANTLPPESEPKKSLLLKCLQKKYGTRVNFNDEYPKHQDAEKMDNSKVAAATEVSEVQKVTKEVEPSFTTGLLVESTSTSVAEKYSHVRKEEMNRDKEHDTGGHQKEDDLLEIEQPKSVLQTTRSPSVDTNVGAGVLELMVPEEYKAWIKKRMKLLCSFSEVNLHKENCFDIHKKEFSLLETKQPKSVLQSTQSPSVGMEPPGAQTMSIEWTDCQRKIIKVAGESGRNLHDNEEQLQLGDFPLVFEKQRNDPSGKPLELMVQSPLLCLTSDNEPEEGQDLPFVKSLPMWKIVESMEIFKVMPQNPHFHPLVKSTEILREGLAFGHMLSFASLVHKTSKLTFADPKKLFTSILNALPELEILGFDVKAVRDRMSNLLSMKDRYGDLQHHLEELELQVKQCSDELTKINEEIDENYKMMRELEQKQALLLSSKDSAMSQITSLEVCADDTTKGIQKVEADFESLAGSTW